MGLHVQTFAALGVGLAFAAPARAQEKLRIAVIDLRPEGEVTPGEAANLTDVVTVTLTKLAAFDVLARADLQQMVAFEQDRQLMGCESDASCLAEIGGALGVAMLVTGTVGRFSGGPYAVSLQLTDIQHAKVQARERREAAADALSREVETAAKVLVRDLLAGQQGFLIVRASEGDADVEVDGRIVGATPISRLPLAGGPHTVKVLKKGFVAWARDVDIQKDEPTLIDAELVPSLEVIEAHESSAATWRLGSYITGGLGVAGIGFGPIAYYVVGSEQAARYNADVEANDCGVGGTGAGSAACAALAGRRSDIETLDVVSMVVGGVGVASLAAAAYLFLFGPDPDLYEAFKGGAAASLGVSVAPLPGGFWTAASARF